MSDVIVPFTVGLLMSYLAYCVAYSEVKNPDPETYYLFLVIWPPNNVWPVLVTFAAIAAGVYQCFG